MHKKLKLQSLLLGVPTNTGKAKNFLPGVSTTLRVPNEGFPKKYPVSLQDFVV